MQDKLIDCSFYACVTAKQIGTRTVGFWDALIFLSTMRVSHNRGGGSKLESLRVDRIVSSPFTRAAKTGEIIAQRLGKPLHLAADLIECNFGSFEGRIIREVMNEYSITTKQSLAGVLPTDGETWEVVSKRSLRRVKTWLGRYAGARILFVAHDAVLQSIAESLSGHWFDGHHGKTYRFSRTAGIWTVRDAI
jgi:broad specificity phosphatase PhoE